jgi:hypothetical protein
MLIMSLHYRRDFPGEMHQVVENRNTVRTNVRRIPVRTHQSRAEASRNGGCNITIGITDHPGLRRIKTKIALRLCQHTRSRFSAIALIFIRVRANVYTFNIPAYGAHISQHRLMNALQFISGQLAASDTSLIRNYEHAISFLIQFGDCFGRVRQEHEFTSGDNGIGTVLIYDAIAIQKDETTCVVRHSSPPFDTAWLTDQPLHVD